MKRIPAKFGVPVAAATLLLMAGCASTDAIDEVRGMAQQAQQEASEARRIANEAMSRAERAEQTANAANQRSMETDAKLDEMFRRAMLK
jgi:outer membrane murein-binding lipoprotein Lpp